MERRKPSVKELSQRKATRSRKLHMLALRHGTELFRGALLRRVFRRASGAEAACGSLTAEYHYWRRLHSLNVSLRRKAL
eukprot:scaffold702_cov350-Pinguiococcus_pyrenoidosus.AAC.8